jgi:hypothetical protein
VSLARSSARRGSPSLASNLLQARLGCAGSAVERPSPYHANQRFGSAGARTAAPRHATP